MTLCVFPRVYKLNSDLSKRYFNVVHVELDKGRDFRIHPSIHDESEDFICELFDMKLVRDDGTTIFIPDVLDVEIL